MKPFEEQYTAWVDGELTGTELAAFESELEKRHQAGSVSSRVGAEADRQAAQAVGNLLRTHSRAPALKNADFFNHQLLQQIEAEQAEGRKQEGSAAPALTQTPAPISTGSLVSLWRLIWAGSSCLAIGAIIFFTLVLPQIHPVTPSVDYFAQVLNTRAGDPAISAVAYHDKKENVTVLWLDGLDYVPAESAHKRR